MPDIFGRYAFFFERGLGARKRGERVRGDLRVIIRAGGRADVIDELPLETYLRAVVPREMSPSRPIEALKAQAVAARSYAIDHFRPLDKAWDVHDDGSSQAYGGIDAERAKQLIMTARAPWFV